MLVHSVDNVVVRILKSFPPQLEIKAGGWVGTGGWSNFRLEAAPTIDPGHTWAFNLVGDPPTGIATQVLTKVTASIVLDVTGDMPSTVQINAATNSVSSPVGSKLSDGMNLGSPPPGYSEEYGVADYRAVRIGAEIFVRCSGILPNRNEYADLRKMPWRIWPPQLGFFRYSPQITLPAQRPFGFVSRFIFPTEISHVTVNDANGKQDVEIHEPSILPTLAAPRGKAAKTNRAIGYGDSLQQAIDNAIVQLPAQIPGSADILFRYTVHEQGKLVGGFFGFETYYVEVERNP